jgi:hypothetical protein
MRGRSRIYLLFLVLSLVSASTAEAQNVIPNGTFDTDLSDWLFIENETWSEDDADGSAESGSAEIAVTGSAPTTDGLVACVPIEQGREYQFGAAVKILSQDGASGDVRVGFVWQVNTQCTEALNDTPHLLSLTTTGGDWERLEGSVVAPVGAIAAGFLLQTRKLGGGDSSTLTGRFDNVVAWLVACGDPVRIVASAPAPGEASAVTASDALFILRAAVGIEVCANCVCDVTGDGATTATDALTVLTAAVGIPVNLQCPSCDE